ncbi:MAG TPA: ATP-binding protein [Trebonia sp.]|nr:ATP-binding protein [Trebonia sp.]
MPISCLALLCGLVTAAALSGYPHGWHWLRIIKAGHLNPSGAAAIGGTGIAAAAVAIVLLCVFAGRLTREVDELAVAARRLAGEQLPREIAALRDGQPAAVADVAAAPRPRSSIAQLAEVADAVASVHRSAVAAATAEAALRAGFRGILVSLGKRNQSLLHRQLRIIDTLEQQAASPAALADLFALDHLTTRMRRHAESLTILSGAAPGHSWNGPVPVIDVMRAAAAEVEDYTRVTVMSDSDEAITASAVTDVIHLLAELIENATLFSPSSTRVEVRAERVANGFAVEVEDRGLGIPADQLRELNAHLASPPDFDSADADRLGLFVVGRLAVRHGVHVSLAPSPYRGTKAVVVLPEGVMIAAPQPDTGPRPATVGRPTAVLADDRSVRLNLRAPEVLSLAGAATGGASAAGTQFQADAQPDLQPGAQVASTQVKVTEELPAVTLHGLPRRVRPTGQSQGERDAAPGADESPARPSPVESPAPDAARSLAASLQSSWHRSRRAHDTPDSEFAADNQSSARHDPRATDGALDSED